MAQSEAEDVLKQNKSNNRMKFGEIVLREKKVDASDIIKLFECRRFAIPIL